MADKVKVWFDADADYLEVRFSDGVGLMKETGNDAVMERVDAEGHVIGFSVMGGKPLQQRQAARGGAGCGLIKESGLGC